MADIVGSLFGLSTEQLQRDRLAQEDAQARTFAGMDRNQQAQYAGYKLGGMLGRGAGQLLGIQDPELARASALENILKQTQQEAISGDPIETYSILAKKLADAGFSREALQAQQELNKLSQDTALNNAKVSTESAQGVKYKAEALKALREDDPKQKIFLELAKNSSPKAVAQAIKAGYDVSLLDSPEKTKLSAYGQQLVDAGYQVGTPEFEAKMREYLDAEVSGKSKGSGNVSVNVGGVSIDSGKLSENAGKEVGTAVANIEDQYSELADFAKAKKLLDEGIFSGQYGKVQMDIAKSTRQNLTKVARTEKFKAYIAQNVIKRLKDIGGNDTQEERTYLEKMVGGEISLEPETLRAVIDSGEEKIKNIIARRKAQVKSASTGSPIPLDPVEPMREFTRDKNGRLVRVK